MKKFRLFPLLVVASFCLAVFSDLACAQNGPKKTHVERFASLETRAERSEANAAARLLAHPDDADALNERSLARMRLGHYKEASEDLRRALSVKPNNAVFLANLGYALWKLGQPTEALATERAAVDIDSNYFTAQYQLGRFLLIGGDSKFLPEAIDHLSRALKIDPRHSEVRFDLLTAYRLAGNFEQALAQLDVLHDSRPSDPRVSYARGLLASDKGNLKEAITEFQEALHVDPTLHGARQDLGLAYIKLNRWPEAVVTFAEQARLQSDSVDAAYFHALSLYNAERSAEADKEVRRALRLDGGSSAAHTLLGIILFTGGHDVEARETLEQAVALDPQSFDAQYYLGRVAGDMKDYTGALMTLRRAVELNPRHAFARFLLGNALERTGSGEAALVQYKELVNLDRESALSLFGLGALLVKQGKTLEAISALENSIRKDPSIYEAHWALGRALVMEKRDNEAIDAFRRAIAVSPERPDGHYQLGLTLRRVGQLDEATRELDKAKRITEDFRTSTGAEQ